MYIYIYIHTVDTGQWCPNELQRFVDDISQRSNGWQLRWLGRWVLFQLFGEIHPLGLQLDHLEMAGWFDDGGGGVFAVCLRRVFFYHDSLAGPQIQWMDGFYIFFNSSLVDFTKMVFLELADPARWKMELRSPRSVSLTAFFGGPPDSTGAWA